MESLKRYIDLLLNEKIPACKKLKRQFEILNKYLEMEKKGLVFKMRNESGEIQEREFIFDKDKANKANFFIEKYCKINNKGKLKNIELELFQRASNEALYGFVDKESKKRLHRERFTVVARKNGKTTERAANAIYMLVADNEFAAQIVCVATRRDQAMLLFNPGSRMVRNSSVLKKIITKRKSDLYYNKKEASFMPLATRTTSLDGLDVHYGVLDEIHAQKGRETYDDLIQATSAREQPIIDIISTFGFLRGEIFDNLYETAENELFLEGFHRPEKLNIIYEMENKEEIKIPQLWIKANPGIGKIKSYEYLEKQIKKAETNESYINTVLTKDFNIVGTKAENFLTWEEINQTKAVKDEYLNNSYCIGGCDLAAVGDLTCATVEIKKSGDDNFYFLQMFFIPETAIEEAEKIGSDRTREAPYKLWADQGHIVVCPGSLVDYREITKWYLKLANERNIRPVKIGYDRAFSGYWAPEMIEYGFELEKIAQGSFTWSQPMQELKRLFKDKKIIYNNNPVTRWCLSNVGQKNTREENAAISSIMPVKLGKRRRIDGFVSMLNAHACLLKNYEEYMRYVR